MHASRGKHNTDSASKLMGGKPSGEASAEPTNSLFFWVRHLIFLLSNAGFTSGCSLGNLPNAVLCSVLHDVRKAQGWPGRMVLMNTVAISAPLAEIVKKHLSSQI